MTDDPGVRIFDQHMNDDGSFRAEPATLRIVTPDDRLVVEFRGDGTIEIGDLDHAELVAALREAFAELHGAFAPFASGERNLVARKIRARIDELGGLERANRSGGYLRGCVHGLDHALHMVEGRPHPADPT